MNARTLVGRTVIVVVTDQESVKGTVEPESSKDHLVISRPLVVNESGQETAADGQVWVPMSSVRWLQVI